MSIKKVCLLLISASLSVNGFAGIKHVSHEEWHNQSMHNHRNFGVLGEKITLISSFLVLLYGI